MPRIASPMHFEPAAGVYPCVKEVRPEGERTLQGFFSFFVRQGARTEIKSCNVESQKKVPRIQLAGALHVPHGVSPPSLAAIDPCADFINLGVVRQSASRDGKLGLGAVVIERSPIKV